MAIAPFGVKGPGMSPQTIAPRPTQPGIVSQDEDLGAGRIPGQGGIVARKPMAQVQRPAVAPKPALPPQAAPRATVARQQQPQNIADARQKRMASLRRMTGGV